MCAPRPGRRVRLKLATCAHGIASVKRYPIREAFEYRGTYPLMSTRLYERCRTRRYPGYSESYRGVFKPRLCCELKPLVGLVGGSGWWVWLVGLDAQETASYGLVRSFNEQPHTFDLNGYLAMHNHPITTA